MAMDGYQAANTVGAGLEAGGTAFPPLAALGLAIQGGSAIAQALRSAKQKQMANQINTQRPTFNRTAASLEMEQRAKSMANSTRLPNQAYYENLLGQQTSQTANKALQTSNSSAEAIAGLTAADRNQREGLNQLAGQGADYRLQSEQYLANSLQNAQGEQLEQFDYNQNQPYQTNMLKKQSLVDASNRNFQGALGSAGQLANDALTLAMASKGQPDPSAMGQSNGNSAVRTAMNGNPTDASNIVPAVSGNKIDFSALLNPHSISNNNLGIDDSPNHSDLLQKAGLKKAKSY